MKQVYVVFFNSNKKKKIIKKEKIYNFEEIQEENEKHLIFFPFGFHVGADIPKIERLANIVSNIISNDNF